MELILLMEPYWEWRFARWFKMNMKHLFNANMPLQILNVNTAINLGEVL